MKTPRHKNLLIIFVKNLTFGKVKTRLAKSIGDQKAFEVYQYLLQLTEEETNNLEFCDVQIYYSDFIDEHQWNEKEKFIQQGNDLGERMLEAFVIGFNTKYEKIICIGSDLPDLDSDIINQAFHQLSTSDFVLGPAKDGGYYLIGMKEIYPQVFLNKSWSNPKLFVETISELKSLKIKYSLLIDLNDIDTLEDLKNSKIASKFSSILC